MAQVPALDPFDLVDPWLFTHTRDYYSIGWAFDELDHIAVYADPGSNGIPDFLEDLRLVGLGTADPLPDFEAKTCGWAVGGNACLARAVLDMLRVDAYKVFQCGADGTGGSECVGVELLIEGEPGAPAPGDFYYQFLDGSESERVFSIMGFGGGNLAANYIGMSETVDVRNVRNENNGKKDYGVMTTSLFRYLFKYMYESDEILFLVKTLLAGVVPGLGGIPFGEMEGDADVVDLTIPEGALCAPCVQRRKVLNMVLDMLSLGLSALTVHEMGHSLGLVAYGAPPYGLFGSEKKAAFIESAGGSEGAHIDTAGMNIMVAGPGSGNVPAISIEYVTDPFHFNELNLAYLQGRLVALPEY